MGNICRSPTAEAVFRQQLTEKNWLSRFEIASAGTHAYHCGEAPDLRAQQAAKHRGIDMSQQRARQVVFGDFADFDYLLAMDADNYDCLHRACPANYQHKIHYFLDYAPQLKTREVPDPYYGGQYGFEKVLDMIEIASAGFLAALQTRGELN